MRIAIFCHSLISDWNHGNAHFLRGVIAELMARGHTVAVYEPRHAWSVEHLLAEAGEPALHAFSHHYPHLKSKRYEADFDLKRALDGIDLVLVHEWNAPELIRRIGEVRRQSPGMMALFHDTHHRAVSDPGAIAATDLRHYDGVLVFGRSLASLYQLRGLARRIFVWHEAADTRVFHPLPEPAPACDLVWIGNWGDQERSAELREFLIDPVRQLGLRARVYGVRYPQTALQELRKAGIEYCGWLPNFEAPRVMAAARVTIHVPRMPYVRALPGIPTIRVFEALACRIPLVCAPWQDSEGLFEPGVFQIAADGNEMCARLAGLLAEPAVAWEMADRGLRCIRARHTCAHRAAELLDIYQELAARPLAARNLQCAKA
jgi:spore maturation protein CgeB